MSKNAGTAAVFALAAVLAHAGAARAQQTPTPVQRTLNVVSAEARTIMAWVYPTVKLRSVADCRWNTIRGGYDLNCPFLYVDSDGDAGHRRLVFRLDGAGIITGIRDAGGSDPWPAFATLALASELLAQVARDELARGGGNDQLERALLDLLARGPQPEEVLAFLLDVRIVSQL